MVQGGANIHGASLASYFLAQKWGFGGAEKKQTPARKLGGARWVRSQGSEQCGELLGSARVRSGQVTSDVDQVVGDDAQPDPAFHAVGAAVAAAVQPVSPLQYTDASFRSRPPPLGLAEPAFPLLPPTLRAARRTIRNRDLLHSPLPRLFLIGRRVESGVGG